MWSLVKMVLSAVVLGAAAYGLFFIDLGGQSLVGHVMDVWRTPVVQEKIDQAKQGVQHELEERLAEAGEKAGRETARIATDELTEADRKGLEVVLQEVTQ